MQKYNPEIHKRRSVRLKNYDYSQEGLYFITICCQDKTHLFGKIIDGVMILNPIGKIVKQCWEETPNIRPNVVLHQFVVMPNHFHAIVEIVERISPTNVGANSNSPSDNGTNCSDEYNLPNDTPNEKQPLRGTSNTIGAIVRGFKIATIKRIKDLFENEQCEKGENNGKGELQFAPTTMPKIWQRNYHEHIIRNEQSYFKIAEYIENNPLKWEEDCFYL